MKKILMFLCPLLIALGFLFLPCHAKYVSASAVDIDDDMKATCRQFIDGEISAIHDGTAHYGMYENKIINGYIIFYDDIGRLWVTLCHAPEYFHFNTGGDTYSVPHCMDIPEGGCCFQYYYDENNKEFRVYMVGGFFAFPPSGIKLKGDLKTSVLYCNFDIKDESGKVFFHRRSLAVPDLLGTSAETETPKEVAGIVKIAVLIAVSLLLSLMLLPKLVRKSLGLLVK